MSVRVRKGGKFYVCQGSSRNTRYSLVQVRIIQSTSKLYFYSLMKIRELLFTHTRYLLLKEYFSSTLYF